MEQVFTWSHYQNEVRWWFELGWCHMLRCMLVKCSSRQKGGLTRAGVVDQRRNLL